MEDWQLNLRPARRTSKSVATPGAAPSSAPVDQSQSAQTVIEMLVELSRSVEKIDARLAALDHLDARLAALDHLDARLAALDHLDARLATIERILAKATAATRTPSPERAGAPLRAARDPQQPGPAPRERRARSLRSAATPPGVEATGSE